MAGYEKKKLAPLSENLKLLEAEEIQIPLQGAFIFFLPPENIKKLYGFLMLSGGREKMHISSQRQFQ